ncbi:MAG TPA: DUF2167 domain-containing protein [Pyrinomonadaceae bacterium]|nr:DUF2167 domain-containing protein [Pyrinomonadaceae bacterium]
MKMRLAVVLSLVSICFLIANGQTRKPSDRPSPTPDSASSPLGVKWQKGPSIGDLGSVAEVHVPAGYVFAGANDTRIIMEANRNPISGKELGFVAPSGEDWFAVFEFEDVGFVRDDEKNSLDANALLDSIKAGTEEGNKERQKRGWPIMTIIGWEQPPRYNDSTHNLEWAIRGESEGAPVINYNTRLLGRGGVMEVTLVTDPSTLSETLPKFKTMFAGFDFNQGQKYADVRQGDKIAEYGLTGLIVGGTTAVLVKTGMFKWLWKLLVAMGIAVSAFIKKLIAFIKKLFSRGNAELGS